MGQPMQAISPIAITSTASPPRRRRAVPMSGTNIREFAPLCNPLPRGPPFARCHSP